MPELIIGITDNLKFEKIVNILQYLCNFNTLITFNLSINGLYIQCQNINHIILFELDIPSYWFDYYQFIHNINFGLTIEINELCYILQNKCPGFIWMTFDINNSSTIIINSEECYYENPYNCEVSPEDCYYELHTYYELLSIEPLLILPTNDKYQYHLVIEHYLLQSIIDELIQNNKTELTFHCSTNLEEVILYGNEKPLVILQNHNSITETENFILTVNIQLLSQLPFKSIKSIIVYLFINPNTPIKISFPLDETDDLIDFNINISPNEIYHVNNNETDFFNMCNSMSKTVI